MHGLSLMQDLTTLLLGDMGIILQTTCKASIADCKSIQVVGKGQASIGCHS